MEHKNGIIAHESYRFMELKGKRCIDFLPSILPNVPKELDILKVWQAHFESQRVPYYVAIISKSGSKRIEWALYKESRCEY